MKKTYTDGWHIVCGYKVYVEDGRITRGVSDDGQETTAPYTAHWENGFDDLCRPIKVQRGWDNDAGVTVDAFRSGVKRGTKTMK